MSKILITFYNHVLYILFIKENLSKFRIHI